MKQNHYHWIGFKQDGQKISGEMVAKNLTAAKNNLREQNILPWRIKRQLLLWSSGKNTEVKTKQISAFANELMLLIKAGIPLVNALQIMLINTERLGYRTLLQNIKYNLEQGASLSKTLAKYPAQFDQTFINLIHIGEESGTLETMLEHIVTIRNKLQQLKRQTQKALCYPAIIITVALLVTLVLLLFVVPRFQELWQSFGATLPYYTQLIINLATWLKHYGTYSLFIVAIFFGSGIGLYRKSPTWRYRIQKWLATKAPLVKHLLSQILAARLLRILAITFAAGLPLLSALKLATTSLNNNFYQQQLKLATEKIAGGTMLSVALQNIHIFPKPVISMLAIGEETGNLDNMLKQIADHYEEHLNNLITNLNLLLEPIIMLVLGAIVGAIIIAMYLPIFRMGQVI